jgi:cyanophycinase-like exopeptidase
MSSFVMALLGSGEFEPWTEAVDRWVLEHATGDGTVLILPAASAPEGDVVFDRWAEMGLRHFEGEGIRAEVVPVKTREDADVPEYTSMLERASIVYFSGGNPAYLVSVLKDSSFWQAVLRGMEHGLGYVGCSAGIASLGERAPDSAVPDPLAEDSWRRGLGVFPMVDVVPHWDALDRFRRGLRDRIVGSVPANRRLLAIDERTALVGDGVRWSVMGARRAHLLEGGAWIDVGAGEALEAALLPESKEQPRSEAPRTLPAV